jgi:glycosyltransferase involved in cell wall biosynthesis
MLSIVTPVYNEQENIPKLYDRLVGASPTWNLPFEVILIDDGSTDRTLSLLRKLHQKDSRFARGLTLVGRTPFLPITMLGLTLTLTSIFPDLEKRGIKQIKVFRTKTAATVCDKNFSHKVPAYRKPIPNLYVANMAHVYPDERSVNNSIKVALNVDASLQIY